MIGRMLQINSRTNTAGFPAGAIESVKAANPAYVSTIVRNRGPNTSKLGQREK